MAPSQEDIMNGMPLHVLRPTADHNSFELDEDAMKILTSIKGPVTVLSIVGTQRGGKSTLMNLFCARKCSGFSVGHYMDPQTTGIWVRVRRHPRNKDLTVLLLDTEGLDSPHVRQDYNWILSAFVLLISNAFVYQTKGSIDANAIDRLGVILRVAEQLRGGDNDQSKTTNIPSFVWLLRDHHLSMTQETPKEEMLSKLDGASIKALQRVFKGYDCFPLPRPVDADSQLKEIETMTFSQLQESFKEEYVVFERLIFDMVGKPVKFAGQEITGGVLADLIRKYSTAVSSKEGILSELSQLPTQQQMIIQLAGERAVRASVTLYRDEMAPLFDRMPVGEEELAKCHEEAKAKAEGAFEQEAGLSGGAPGEGSSVDQQMWDEYRLAVAKHIAVYLPVSRSVADTGAPSAEIQEEKSPTIVSFPASSNTPNVGYRSLATSELVGGLFAQVWRANSHRSHTACEAALASLVAPVREAVAADGYADVAAFDAAVGEVVAQYESDPCRGVAKPLLLKDFVEQDQRSLRETVLRACQQRTFDKALEAQATAFRQLLAEQIKTAREELSSEIKGVKEAVDADLVVQKEALKQADQASQERDRAATEALREKAHELTESFNTNIAKEATRIAQLEVESARTTTQVQGQVEKLQSLQQSMTESTSALTSLRADTTKRLDECSASLKEGLSELRESTTKSLEAQAHTQKEALKDLKTSTSEALADKTTTLQKSLDDKAASLQKDLARDIEKVEGSLASIKTACEAQIKEASAAERERVVAEAKAASEANATERARVATELKELVKEARTDLKSELKSASENLKSELKSASDASSLELKTSVNELTGGLKDLGAEFKSSISANSSELKTAVQEVRAELKATAEANGVDVKSTMQEVRAELKASTEASAAERGRITGDVKASVSELRTEVTASLSKQEERLERHRQETEERVKQVQSSVAEENKNSLAMAESKVQASAATLSSTVSTMQVRLMEMDKEQAGRTETDDEARAQLQKHLAQLDSQAKEAMSKIGALGSDLADVQTSMGSELSALQKSFEDQTTQQLTAFAEQNKQQLDAVQEQNDQQVQATATTNQATLEEIQAVRESTKQLKAAFQTASEQAATKVALSESQASVDQRLSKISEVCKNLESSLSSASGASKQDLGGLKASLTQMQTEIAKTAKATKDLDDLCALRFDRKGKTLEHCFSLISDLQADVASRRQSSTSSAGTRFTSAVSAFSNRWKHQKSQAVNSPAQHESEVQSAEDSSEHV